VRTDKITVTTTYTADAKINPNASKLALNNYETDAQKNSDK